MSNEVFRQFHRDVSVVSFWEDTPPTIRLPHQCDAWEFINADHARKVAAALVEAADWLDNWNERVADE